MSDLADNKAGKLGFCQLYVLNYAVWDLLLEILHTLHGNIGISNRTVKR